MATKRRLKKKWKKFFINIALIILILIFGFSIYNIVKHNLESKKTNEQLNDIQDIVNVEEVTEIDDVEVIEPVEEIPKSNPYWDYINMNLIDVNFNDLKNINKDVKGWIQVNGTNINYPFVQGSNNDYYLTHSFDKSYNSAGWVFLDYRNDLSNYNNKNTIIYAHGRLDKTMFGSLRNALTNGWLNNSNNYVIKLSTEYENTLWQVFSVYHIPTTSDYLKVDFNTDEQFNSFTNMLIERSSYNFNTNVSSNDRILTLSTCYDKTDKVVLHAKLIKREAK